MVPVDSVEVPRDSTYSGIFREANNCRIRACHPLWTNFPIRSASRLLGNSHGKDPTTPPRKTSAVWADSRSLAATEEIDFSFFSCGYLDVSVLRVRRMHLWIQCMPVRESRDQHSLDNSPELIAVFHALQSLLTPRHPPCALSSLTAFIQHSSNPIPKDQQTQAPHKGNRIKPTVARSSSPASAHADTTIGLVTLSFSFVKPLLQRIEQNPRRSSYGSQMTLRALEN